MSGKRFALAGALMGSTAIIGPMTAAERSRGRYMRAPDGHGDAGGSGDAAFDAFNDGAEVEVGKTQAEVDAADGKPAPKPARSGRGPRDKPADPGAEKLGKAAADKAAGKDKPAAAAPADADDAGTGDDDDDDDIEEEPEPEPKPRRTAKERIQDLTGKTRSQERLITQLSTRLEALEKGGLPAGTSGGKSGAAEKPAPDPEDAEKYPLGHLDDRYIEDKLDWLAERKATEKADAALQREQGKEQEAAATAAHAELLEKVDDLSTRGSELFEDFQETVVEGGLAGKWDLGQPTFEAAHEAENGAQILYDLASDKKEATRVAKLSPYGQMKFVMDRDAEITAKAKPRTKPGAGEPPQTRTRGANSSNRIDPATDDLDDFEKAWKQDEKANG